MIERDYPEFEAVLAAMFDLYGKPLPSEFALALWWKALEDYSLAEVKRGLTLHARNPDAGQFMPKPADVIRAISGSSADNSSLAWSKVIGAIRRVGSYESVAFDDPFIHRVIADMGGWVRLCNDLTDDDLPFVQREFENRYRGLAVRGEVGDYPPVLMGVANLHNSSSAKLSKFVKPPVLIGDQQVAQKVMARGNHEYSALAITRQSPFKTLGAAMNQALEHVVVDDYSDELAGEMQA